MSIRDDFFAAKAKGSLWDVAVSIKRGNPLPLDADSIFESYEALETYAADVLAYPGQVVAVVNADSTGIYYLDQNLAIQPVGVIPAGDNLSVVMDDNDVIILHNYVKVFYKYIAEVKDQEGNLTSEARYDKTTVSDSDPWKAGLEPRVVTEDGKLVIGWYEPNPTTIDGVNDQVTAVQGTVADLEESVGVPSAEGQEATGLYKEVEDVQEDVENLSNEVGTSSDSLSETVTTVWAHINNHETRIEALEDIEIPVEGVAADDKILTLGADKLIAATVAMSYDSENKKIVLTGKEGVELGSVDATPFIKDGMLHDVEYDADSNTLTFTWNTDAGENKTDTVVLSDIIEPYTAGNGLDLTGNAFSVKLADGSESFLTVTEAGLKLSGIADAIATAKQEAIDEAATAAAGIYATQTALGDLETAVTGRLDALEEYDHSTYATKEELTAHADTAAETYATKAELEPVTTTANNASTAVTNLEARFDEIVAVGGEPNAINKIQVNGSELAITDKTVNIPVPKNLTDLGDWTSVDERITAAKAQADKGVSDASAAASAAATNAAAIEGHATRISTLEGHVGDSESGLLKDVADLKAHDTAHGAEFNTLKETVNEHSTTIAGWETSKADTTALNNAVSRIAANETAITTLNETTIPGINTEIGKKANSADVYTKTEVEDLIDAAKSDATYDDTAIKADIKANTDAIAILNGDINTTGSVAKTAAEAAKTEVATLIGDAPEALDTIHEIAAWIQNDETGAAALTAKVSEHSEAIAAINDENTGILALANDYTDAAIAALPAATAEALGLVKVDDVTIQAVDGVISVKKITTDMIDQGTEEFILNGGSATK